MPLEDNLVEVVERQGKGRSLVAARHLQAGEVALVSQALVAGVFPSQASNCCARCLRRRPLSMCADCDCIGYCSQRCREADDSSHRLECPAIDFLNVRLRAEGESVWHGGDAVLNALLLARVVRAKLPKDSAAAKLASPFTGKPKALRAALSAPPLHIPKVIAKATLAAAAEFPGFLPKSWLDAHTPSSRLEELISILMQLQVNSCGVIEPTLFEAVGEGVFVEGALANHDCEPNSHFIFHWAPDSTQPVLHLQCIQDIAPGHDITISYHDAARPVWERRRRLQRSHWFTCKCARCERELNRENLPSQACLVGDKKGRVLRPLLLRTIADANEEATVLGALRMVGVDRSAESVEARLEAAFTQIASSATETHASANLADAHARGRLRKTLETLRETVDVAHPHAAAVFELRTCALAHAQVVGDANVVADMAQELVVTCERVYHSFDMRRVALLELQREALQALRRHGEAAAIADRVKELRKKLGQEVEFMPSRNHEGVVQIPETDRTVSSDSSNGSTKQHVEWVESASSESNNGRPSAFIIIDLPATVASMADVELDISPELVRVSACGGSTLHEFPTPFTIDVAEAKAIFSRRSRTLKIMVTAT